MRDKFFTYADRVGAYAEGKRAFEEGRLRSYNPYATSTEFSGLWCHGWDMAERKSKVKSHQQTNTLCDPLGLALE